MTETTIENRVSPVTKDVVDDAVGVSEKFWYVAIVNHNSEKKTSEILTKSGIENYVPTQQEIRIWRNGRKTKVEKVVIPSNIFIHCTEQKRRELTALPYIYRFMTDKARNSVNATGKPIAKIPADQIERLKFMLGQSDIPIEITAKPFRAGDKVRIIRGPLTGLEGEVLEWSVAKVNMIVFLGFFGCTKLQVEKASLKKLSY